MAFVYEKLNEEDKVYLASFKFKDPLSSCSLARIPRYWISDRERGIFLVSLGGQGYRFDKEYPPTYYRLIWEGYPIKIAAYFDWTGDNETGVQAIWDVDRIVIPRALDIDIDLLIETIKEVFETYERGRSQDTVFLSIKFVLIATPTFVEGDVTYG